MLNAGAWGGLHRDVVVCDRFGGVRVLMVMGTIFIMHGRNSLRERLRARGKEIKHLLN